MVKNTLTNITGLYFISPIVETKGEYLFFPLISNYHDVL